ncbi:MAG: beta-N-acetylhexosaminidase [Candidatus Hydrogenedentes bacterium]|nr:beta-N-acetylhexosaminidase [Candidatus Hydrogenedentota bacterium]
MINRLAVKLALLSMVLAALAIPAYADESAINIIPRPSKMTVAAVKFVFGNRVQIVVDSSRSVKTEPVDKTGTILSSRVKPTLDTLDDSARYLADGLKRRIGVRATIAAEARSAKHSILLTTAGAPAEFGDEGYELSVTNDGIVIRASKPAGVFYGVESLLQLLPAKGARSSARAIPCLTITDQPQFAWRGLMMDCSRTFLSMNYLRRYVDLLAQYKMNVLHLHLTDDQGWRMQSETHPELTSVGAKFDPRFEGQVSGFYTKQELRDLVRYAAGRNVTIVPEIEMPSHCVAALTAYPDLSCRGDAYFIAPYIPDPTEKTPVPPYGVFCAGNDKTFQVLEDVLAEVIDVFPCKYIHIGGDECPKEFWKTCPKCQARMKHEGLKDENELQSYFVKRIEKFINGKNRVLLGWDEILEGGLAPNAVVMSWRGTAGGIAAARSGHDVVMSPTSHCYFDYEYATTPVDKVYAFDPIPAELTADQGARILGAQANMWTHIARTESDIDQMIFPRLVALSETVWSPKEGRDWPGFERRLQSHLARLKSEGVTCYSERPGPPSFAISPDGTPWVLEEGRAMAYRNGRWSRQPGKLRQIAFTKNGQMLAVGATPVPGGFEVLERIGSKWRPLKGAPGAVDISSAPNAVSQVRIGPEGELWALGASPTAGGYDILTWTGSDWKLVSAGAAATVLAPGAHKQLYALNSLGVAFRWENGAWTVLPGHPSAIAAGPDSRLWVVMQGSRSKPLQLMTLDGAVWKAAPRGRHR